MHESEPLEVPTIPLPRGLPPKARERLQKLGLGGLVDRKRLVEVCGSEPAADQFYLALAPKGYIVPIAWGRYAVPKRETLRKLAVLPHAPLAQAVAWAETLTWALGRPEPYGLLGLASWTDPLLNIPSPAPVFVLQQEQKVLRGLAPQLEPFFIDLLQPLTRLELADRQGQVLADLPRLHPLDEARLLLVNADSRFREAGRRRREALSPQERDILLDALRKTGFPEPAPRGRKVLRLPMGPPYRYRLYAPPWFLQLHQKALEIEARRRTFG